MQNDTTSPPSTGEPTPPSNIGCGDSPLVKQETGCPCFNAAIINAVMNVTKEAEYCDFYASEPVNASDPCSHLYTPGYAYFSAYTPLSAKSMNFGVSANYDPAMQGAGTCNGGVYYYYSTYKYNETGMTANSTSETHGFDIYLSVTKEQLQYCLDVFNEVKKTLPTKICMINGVGGPY